MERKKERKGKKNISDVYLNSLCAFKNLFYLFSVCFQRLEAAMENSCNCYFYFIVSRAFLVVFRLQIVISMSFVFNQG